MYLYICNTFLHVTSMLKQDLNRSTGSWRVKLPSTPMTCQSFKNLALTISTCQPNFVKNQKYLNSLINAQKT